MFTAKQYRAKAAEYGEFLNVPRSPIEISEFRNLQSTNHEVDERAEVLHDLWRFSCEMPDAPHLSKA